MFGSNKNSRLWLLVDIILILAFAMVFLFQFFATILKHLPVVFSYGLLQLTLPVLGFS